MGEGSQNAMEAQLVACVRDSLDAFLYDNAKFMCERLYAEYPTEENLLLLANTYMQSNQAYRAFNLLSGSHSVSQHGLSGQGRYLLAQCCHNLGKYDEAKTALMQDSKGEVPGGAAGLYLLGRLHSLTDNPTMATTCYQAALMRDPLLWSAYEGLCQLGHNEDAAAILRQSDLASTDPASQQQEQRHPNGGSMQQGALSQTPNSNLSADAPAFVPTPRGVWPLSTSQKHAASQDMFAQNDSDTPGPQTSAAFVTPSPGAQPLQMPAPVRRGGPAGPRETPTFTPMYRGAGIGRMPAGAEFNPNRWKLMDEGKLRKVSNRLFTDPTSAVRNSPNVTTRRGTRGRQAPAAPVMGAPFTFKAGQGFAEAATAAKGPPLSNGSNSAEPVHVPHGARSMEGARGVLSLLQQLGEGYGLLCMYKCQEAIAAFVRLPISQHQTAWVMCQIGRACFEMVDFSEAAQAFTRARQLDPCRLEGMELYSTVLWHLKKEVELSHLAQEAIALDRLDPRSWCIMGNCFSLQKDQDAALKFFQRSLQLDPSFTYAYTLAGHENLALEQFEKSMSCYRNAMRLDPRHYNAWYGVGQIYYRQEKYELAAYHFEGSLKINDCSSVLRCYMGMALAKLNRHEEAVNMLRTAIRADPNNPLARFELASVLVAIECFDEGLAELEALKDMAPREASVYFQIGKIHRRLDRTEQALLYFSTALDLKPSSADVNLIKSAIEKLRISNDSEEEEM